MYSFHLAILQVSFAVHIIITLDCLVIASKISTPNNQPLSSNNNASEISNITHRNVLDAETSTRNEETTTSIPISSILSSKDYYKQWLCSNSHDEFLKVFLPIYQGKDRLCPNRTYTGGSSLSSVFVEPESNISLTGSERRERGAHHQQDNANEFRHYFRSNSSASEFTNNGSMKKIRGCQWDNTTHFCHQHILFRIDEECFQHDNSSRPKIEETDEIVDDIVDMLKSRKPPLSSVWGYGLLSCTAVIICARGGLIILPIFPKYLYEKLIITMVGLAAGTLTGSSIFHLLPKAFSLEEKFHDEEYLHRCLVIAGGLWLFLVIERLLKIIFHHNERKINNRRQRRVSNVLATAHKSEDKIFSVVVRDLDSNYSEETPPKNHNSNDSDKSSETSSDNGKHGNEMVQIKGLQHVSESSYEIKNSSDKYRLNSNKIPEMQTIKFQEGSLSLVSTEAWMVIAGDAFLDFVDGMSIGTAFRDSLLTGFSISIGILCEELPHELGEFAVLLEAGLSYRRAMAFKFLASCSTYLGLCAGIWVGGINNGHYVFAAAAGMFLYIALVDMVPELNEAAMKSAKTSVLKGLAVLVLQNVGLLAGMSIIYVMAVYEDFFRNLEF